MSVECVYLSVIEDDYPVGFGNGGDTLSNYNCGRVRKLCPESVADICVCCGINGACGVIENDYLRLFEQCSCDT